jgi:uncharacterized RDD family membrane protein YckC
MPPPPQYAAQQAVGPAPGVRYASSGGRLIAYIIDNIIVGFVVGIFYFLGIVVIAGGGASVDSAGNATLGAGAGLGFLIVIIGVIIGLLWKPFFWSRGGQTPGYKILGMRLVRSADGGPVGFGTAILRLIGYAISAFVFYLGFIWILFDAKHQGWHDKIANTLVIQA